MLYDTVVSLIRTGLNLGTAFQVQGTENVPATGPVILAANHTSNLDPLFLAAASPRQVHFMAKAELFQWPVLGSFLRAVGTFPVRRGASDREAIKSALQTLARGELLGIFVEGTRNPGQEFLNFKTGAAMLAYRTGAPLLPVVLKFAGRNISVTFSTPIFASRQERIPRKDQYRQINQQLRQVFEELTYTALG